MSAELRCENKWEPLLYARSRIVHALHQQELTLLMCHLDLEDPEGMKKEAIKAKELDLAERINTPKTNSYLK